MGLITVSVHISVGRFSGHRLMLALPGRTAGERHLQGSIDLQDLPLAQPRSWQTFSFRLLHFIFLFFGDMEQEGKKTEDFVNEMLFTH